MLQKVYRKTTTEVKSAGYTFQFGIISVLLSWLHIFCLGYEVTIFFQIFVVHLRINGLD
jgi:hypothetical protein